MSDAQHPDRDSLDAYLEQTLSIDATHWIEQHLGRCARCRAKLDGERRFLGSLEGLGKIEPPSDFIAGVMARVAQYPSYRPSTELPWRRLALWAGSLAAMLLVALLIGAWMVMNSPQGQEVSGYASVGIAQGSGVFKQLLLWGGGIAERGQKVLGVIRTVASGVGDFVRDSPGLQLAVLLITVALNYLFTRMVLNYQRRH